jgi:hypothetical protein
MRLVRAKDGSANTYPLGEVEHPDGTRTGFTVPTMLRQQLEHIPIGAWVRIEFIGTMPTATGYEMMKFATTITPQPAAAQ